MAVNGSVSHPALRYPGYVPGSSGVATVLPGRAGVRYTIPVHHACREPGFRVDQGAGTRAPIPKSPSLKDGAED